MNEPIASLLSVLCEWDNVRAAGLGDDGDRLHILPLLLPCQAAGGAWSGGEAVRRLLRPHLLWVLRPLPGVPRAQESWLRHACRVARQHGEDGEDRRAPNEPGDDSLVE